MKLWKYFKTYTIAIALIALFIPTALAQLPAGVVKVTSVEGITEYQLSNGLRVVMFPDQTKQKILINLVYLVGSRNEGYGETGMAHLLEHMNFKGTPKHTNIPSELNSRGASFNASTSFDRTNYFEQLNASDENLNWALEFEADRMLNSFVARKDLDSEMTVVRNEMESGENSAPRITIQETMATAYQWHNYGKSTIGARADVENVPIDRLQAFYHKYYQPDNAVLVVAGKFDEAKTIDLVNQKFGSIPKPTREIPKAYTIEPVQDGSREVTIERIGDLQWLMAGYHVPAASHPDSAAISIMDSILGDSPSGRLYKSLVETKKATGVFNIDFDLKDPGYILLAAQVDKTASLTTAQEALIQTIETFATTPPTKEEVDRYKTATLKNMETSLWIAILVNWRRR